MTFMQFYSCIENLTALYLLESPTDGHQEGGWVALAPPVYIKSFNAGAQNRPVHTKSRCCLSQRPECPRCVTQAIPTHPTVLQT